uniref:Ig-like domain-containing protein n=1 Tax=Oncorhynchus tshawytscha TaxID=74940 RepID=A0AAZ3S988_ONCTS
ITCHFYRLFYTTQITYLFLYIKVAESSSRDLSSLTLTCHLSISPPSSSLLVGVVRPSLTVLLPSSEEQDQGNVALVCLANRGFPEGWKLGWRLGAGGPLQGSQSLEVLEKDGHYSWSSSLTLTTDQWRKAGSVTCEASLKDQTPVTHTLEPHHCSQ